MIKPFAFVSLTIVTIGMVGTVRGNVSSGIVTSGTQTFTKDITHGLPAIEPLTYFDAWSIIGGFEARQFSIYESHVGFGDLLHSAMGMAYGRPFGSPTRYFRRQTCMSSWSSASPTDSRNGSFSFEIGQTVMGSKFLVSAAWQDEQTQTIQKTNEYGFPSGIWYTNTTTLHATLRADAPQGIPVFDGYRLTDYGEPGREDAITSFTGYRVLLTPYIGANYATADSFYRSNPPGVWTAPPDPWTEANATWHTDEYDYSITLSEEDTLEDVRSRIEQDRALSSLETIPWNRYRNIQHGEILYESTGPRNNVSLYNNSGNLTKTGEFSGAGAQLRFVVPSELRIVGVGYRGRVIEYFYPRTDPNNAQIVKVHEVDMREGQWESAIINPIMRPEDGRTVLKSFSVVAELIQPHPTLVLSLPEGAPPSSVPAEYQGTKPTLVWQTQAVDSTGTGQISRRVLTGSMTLQQINLADSHGSLDAWTQATVKWSILPGSTAAVRLWHWRDDGSPLGAWQQLPADADLKNYFGTDTDFIFAELLSPGTAGIRISINIDDQTVHDDLRFNSTPIGFAVDANRDGVLKLPSEDASDSTTAGRPYRFWVNDDIDRFHSFEDGAAETMANVTESEEDDIGPDEVAKWNTDHSYGPWGADWEDGKIMSVRDLEDFARMHFDLGALHESLKRGDFYLGLKFKRVIAGDPKIQLYPAADSTGGLQHLTQDGTATLQIYDPNYAYGKAIMSRDVEHFVSKDALYVFSLLHWQGEHELRPFIFEGASAGQGELALVLVAANGTTEMGEIATIHMVLQPITEMYEHMTVGNDNGGPPGALSEIHALPIPSDPDEKKYVLFVHGWNMERWEKERFAETAFKRLWWQGYRGRFGLFSWPTTNKFNGTPFKGLTDGTHFDRGEWTAWHSGAGLRELLAARYAAYDGEVYVLSHSMGGVVMGEALRLQSDSTEGRIAKVYVASQAALSSHLYDGGIDASGSAGLQWAYAHPKFNSLPSQSYGPDTANIYPFWFGRFMNGGGDSHSSVAKVVNFYNSNDWALASPAWQFNQIAKPDYPDFLNAQPYLYNYDALLERFGRINAANERTLLNVGDRENPMDRYEIMAFAAESRVKSFGALDVTGPEVTESVNIRLYWPSDAGAHKAHRWHSAEFRSTIVKQRSYWEALLSPSGFAIETVLLQ
jgi:hypothetical protein